jgi:hypothetical protein
MKTSQQTYRKEVKKRYKHVIWIDGDGRYATVAACNGPVTVMLHEILEKAKRAKRRIDSLGCGGNCSDAHTIVDLEL